MFNDNDLKELEIKVRQGMNENRFRHTLGVMYTAAALAMKHGAKQSGDFITRTMVAGLLHDNAKLTEDSKLLEFCYEKNIPVTDCEKENAFLLHGKVGAYFAKTEYGIEDEEILNSITWHTTGRPDMSLMEKIVFVADYIEPRRYKQKNLEYIRELAFTDLDACVYKIASDTVDFLKENNRALDEMTILTQEFYKR